MSKMSIIITGLTVLMVLILVIKMYYDSYSTDSGSQVVRSTGWTRELQTEKLDPVSSRVIEQRNNLSILLNLKQKTLGQMECEKVADKRVATSKSGGWCQNTSKEDSGQHHTDRKLAKALMEFLKGKYVGGFGDGPGRYKQLLLDSGKVKGYDAYDGAPYCETTSEGRVKFLDLTLPQYGLPLYDWVISLEVAEHIPQKFERIYIDNLVRHAREGVILSWARPGQVGYSHVNNKPFKYIKHLMDKLGFSHDDVESQKLKAAAMLNWYKWNTNVYRRKNLPSAQNMKLYT